MEILLIQVTRKLQKELGIKEFKEIQAAINPFFCWHANLVKLGRKKTVILTNDACYYAVVLYGLKKSDFKNIGELIKAGIRQTLIAEGISDDIIEKYLNEYDEIQFNKTKNRSLVARMNQNCKDAEFYGDDYIENEIVQSYVGRKLSHRLVSESDSKDYFKPYERLIELLEDYYGESPRQVSGALLKIELELGEYQAWRRVIVPMNYFFYNLHQVIQKLYSWQDYHLHEFFIYSDEKDKSKNWNHSEYHRDGYKAIYNVVSDEEQYLFNKNQLEFDKEDFEMVFEKASLLKDYLPARIKYIYDFGDNWCHYIEVEEIIEDYNKIDPEFVEGAGTAPPEDVGGVTGFERFMEVISDPEAEDHQFMLDWAQGQKFKKYSESDIKGNLNIIL